MYNLDELFMTLDNSELKTLIQNKMADNDSEWLAYAKELVSAEFWLNCLPKKEVKTKIKGVSARFQSDKEGTSYLKISITNENNLTYQVLTKLEDVLTSEEWGYYCAESLEGEGAVFFGDKEKTIKQMKKDYKDALKIVLN